MNIKNIISNFFKKIFKIKVKSLPVEIEHNDIKQEEQYDLSSKLEKNVQNKFVGKREIVTPIIHDAGIGVNDELNV